MRRCRGSRSSAVAPRASAAARYLQHEGFEPIILERAGALGGQWSGDRRASGIWPSMHTNTSRVLTALGDRPHPPGTPVYPANQAIGAYLRRYAADFGLDRHAHLETEVQSIGRAPGGWRVRTRGPGGSAEETFSCVVIAPGRYHRPALPDVPGLAGFSGPGGVTHTNTYDEAARYRGQRVLVAGCAISALEIASELAVGGAERVVTTNRRQRYVLPKLCGGVPTDHLAFTRAAGLAAELLPPEAIAASLQGLRAALGREPATVRRAGSGGAAVRRRPHAGAALPAAGRGRPDHHSAVDRSGRGSARHLRGRHQRRLRRHHLRHRLPAGPAVPGRRADASARYRRRSISICIASRSTPTCPASRSWGFFTRSARCSRCSNCRRAGWLTRGAARSAHRATPRCAPASPPPGAVGPDRRSCRCTPPRGHSPRRAGVDPDVAAWPALARALLFGPLSPSSFRLSGRDALPDAPSRVEQDAAAFGAITSPGLTAEQCAQLQSLAAVSRDLDFAALVGQLSSLT